MNQLLVLAKGADEYARALKIADLPQLEIVLAPETGQAIDLVAACNIILGDPPLVSAVLNLAVNLQWVQSSWAGVDSLCQPGLRQDYVLTGVKGIFGPQISEYVITYLFALERRIFDMRSNQAERRWLPISYRPARDIAMGIVGLGSIGRHLARTARHFGISVTGMNRSGAACADVERVFTAASMPEFLEGLDYVVVTLPETPQTRGLINAHVLEMMNSSAVLINVGRGTVINEDDLAGALEQGKLGGAVLDVFGREPLAGDSPLWDAPGVLVTPHCSAISFPADVVEIFAENYQRFIRHAPLLHAIKFDRGY